MTRERERGESTKTIFDDVSFFENKKLTSKEFNSKRLSFFLSLSKEEEVEEVEEEVMLLVRS